MGKAKEIEIKTQSESIWNCFDCIRDNGALGIRGMLNLGNSCYMTVLLQIFVHNAAMRNYFLSASHSSQCQQKKGCVSCEIEALFVEFYCGINSDEVAIGRFIGTIWSDTNYGLAQSEMNDCHEFFISITTLMHKSAIHKSKELKLCNCIVHKTFRGRWCSELQCTKCKHSSLTIAPFMEINLDIIHWKTIGEALSDYMESEAMPDYKCSHCLKRGHCKKYMTIHSLPQTLVLHLKRFENDSNNRSLSPEIVKQKQYDKIDEFVEFPVDELLDLTKFVNESHRNESNNKKYRLRAVICHSGVLSSGHYVCCIRKENEWFYCDDSTIRPSTAQLVKNTKAYMLFYDAQ